MLKTNKDKLVKMSVIGEVVSPTVGASIYRVSADGEPMILPGVGGITYNVRVGDLAMGWMADHVEPGVSLENRVSDSRMPHAQSRALNVLSCIGNEATVVKGDAKGEKGVVVGKHGGIEHVMTDFQPEVMEKLVIEDKVMVKAYGVGLKLLDIPKVKTYNLSPNFLKAIDPKIASGKLEVPVTHMVPAAIMGSGLGRNHVSSGDYDITLFCEETVKEYGLEDLRLGDLVAIVDADHSYGRIFRKGAMSVSIVTHSDCVTAGHGPGTTTLFTSKTGAIEPVIDADANIAKILGLRDDL
ncbi:MAG: DUF4438 domain-containing protein [Candidatus Bathyarchaeota archaeon]|nr:DUF4438 domain-containing protein [Candidatus Bathyarchaeota archaeon]